MIKSPHDRSTVLKVNIESLFSMPLFVSRALILGGAALAMSSPALAEAFSGPYVGAQIGWQQDKFGATLGQGVEQLRESQSSDGFTYGGLVGYNYKINNNGVVGIEAAISGATNSLTDEDETVALKSGRTIEIAGRAGALISSKTLIFARAGWTNSRYTVPISENASLGSTLSGFTVGVGAEHALSTNLTARVGYDYSQYSRLRSGFQTAPGVIETYSIRPTRNAVKVGISYNF